jgi:hypothetical protein
VSAAAELILPNVVVNTPAFDAEWSLLVGVCSQAGATHKIDLVRQLCHRVRWRILFDLADRHKVLPLLFQVLSEAKVVPPADMRNFGQLYQTNLHKSLLLARELIHIVENFSENGIEVLPYKGVVLSQMLYGDLAARAAGDIDLLIRVQEFSRARDLLRQLGYTPHLCFSPKEQWSYLKSGYEWAFDGLSGPNLVELQWAIQPRFYGVKFPQEQLFERAVSVEVAGHRMKTPSMEDLFLVLSLHAAKHVWGRLIWLCDLARITNTLTLDWHWIGVQSEKLGISRILQVTLLLLNSMLGVVIPEAANASMPQDAHAAVLASEIQRQIQRGYLYDTESLSYFQLMLRMRERASDRLGFLTRLIFTSGPREWSTVRLPAPLFPLYHLVRFYRLGCKLMKL